MEAEDRRKRPGLRKPPASPGAFSFSRSFLIDYFVYSAPACFDFERRRVVKNEEDKKMFQPYRRQQQRCMMDQGEDGDEFTVADLTHRSRDEVELSVLHHPPRASSGIIQPQWRIKKLPVPLPDMRRINPSLWTTDATFPIGDGRLLCWVDYYHGMLLVDVLLANNDNPADQQQLRYITSRCLNRL